MSAVYAKLGTSTFPQYHSTADIYLLFASSLTIRKSLVSINSSRLDIFQRIRKSAKSSERVFFELISRKRYKTFCYRGQKVRYSGYELVLQFQRLTNERDRGILFLYFASWVRSNRVGKKEIKLAPPISTAITECKKRSVITALANSIGLAGFAELLSFAASWWSAARNKKL